MSYQPLDCFVADASRNDREKRLHAMIPLFVIASAAKQSRSQIASSLALLAMTEKKGSSQ